MQLLAEQGAEALQQIDLVGLHPAQPGVGELLGDGAAESFLHAIEHRLELAWQRQRIEAARDPAIEAVGEQLAAQDRRCIEIAAGRIHLPLQHLAGV